METKNRILVAPLNWGLGHATRCIPIINALITNHFEPIIASDGVALELLKKEFPDLPTLDLPAYNITYPEKGTDLKWHLLKESPNILKAIKAENKQIKKLIKEENISGIISDNRFGVYSDLVPSVYITHQLNVLSGISSWISSKIHQKVIRKFDECWIPDFKNEPSLSGNLGHLKNPKLNIKYINPLSRFKKKDCETVYDLMVLLSGPEPQRSILEDKLLTDLNDYKGTVLFVKGIVEEEQKVTIEKKFTICNFMNSNDLEMAINQSKLILSRSGYTTIMDLSKLEKKAFLIPTPGQFEQEYLAKRFQEKGKAPFCNQNEFNIEMLESADSYIRLQSEEFNTDYEDLFSLFKSK